VQKTNKANSNPSKTAKVEADLSEAIEFQNAASSLGFDYSREGDRKAKKMGRFGFLKRDETLQKSYLNMAADYLISAQFYEFINMTAYIYSAEEKAKAYLIRAGVPKSFIDRTIKRFKDAQKENLMDTVKERVAENKLGIRRGSEVESNQQDKGPNQGKVQLPHRNIRDAIFIDEA